MKYVLRRIGITSAFKVGFVTGALLSAIVFVPAGLLMALGVLNSKGDVGQIVAAGAVGGIVTAFCGPLVYGFVYGIAVALSALIYNVVAGIMGGLEIALEDTNRAG